MIGILNDYYNKDLFYNYFLKNGKFWRKKNGYFDVMFYVMKVYMYF